MDAAWTRTSQSVLDHFNSDAAKGLTSLQAQRHAALYGRNGMRLRHRRRALSLELFVY